MIDDLLVAFVAIVALAVVVACVVRDARRMETWDEELMRVCSEPDPWASDSTVGGRSPAGAAPLRQRLQSRATIGRRLIRHRSPLG